MQIHIKVDSQVEETTIQVNCNRITPEIEKLLATLRMLDKQLLVKREEETHILDVGKIIYMESIDRKTFVYTISDIYESPLRLYELEEQLEDYGFYRVSKSCILQLRNIQSLKADFDRRIRVTMENGEQLMVSRQYADGLKKKLGVR